MNLRTLKKLSKRAAPLLPLLGDTGKQFPARHPNRDNHYHGAFIGDRKHWDRSHCHPTYPGKASGFVRGSRDVMCVRTTTRAGAPLLLSPPSHPRKGTIMVGRFSHGEATEWSEQTAWEALVDIVFIAFTDWDAVAAMGLGGEEPGRPVMLRELGTPSAIFAAATEMIAMTGTARNGTTHG